VTEPHHAADRELARAARRGEAGAADRLAERMRCVPRFLAARNRRMGGVLGADDLADATQEVVAIAWQKLSEFRGDAALETWLHAICGGVFMNAVRRLARQRRVAVAGAGHGGEPEVAEAEPHDFDHVHVCLERLPAAEASVVRARVFDQQEFDAIARREGLSLSALKARYYRALQKLADCLTPYLRPSQ
jgi:RNA polymerase sigma-70 factor (ECF subfamily)